jgi:hypothetical protein
MRLIVPPFSPTHEITHSAAGNVDRIPVVLLGKAIYTEAGWQAQRPSEFTLGDGGELLRHGKADAAFCLEEAAFDLDAWEKLGTMPGLG